MKNRVRELRKENKITLKELAEKMGVSESYAFMMQNKKALAEEHRVKLGGIFGVAPDQVAPLDAKAQVRRRRSKGAKLGKGSDLGARINAIQDALGELAKALGGSEAELLALFGRMSASNRQALITTARSFANN
jgi:transcriptional regulator with XRE-family HTH domain